MRSLRALVVSLSSAVTYNCIAFLAGNPVGLVHASPEPQALGSQCLLDAGALCCAEVTTFKENVCPLASFIANENMNLPDLQTPVGVNCSLAVPILGCSDASATPVCCSTTIPSPTNLNILSVSGVNCTPVTNPL